MHPAYSVIFFTTASGAGFGLLAWLSLSFLTRPVASSRPFVLAAFGIALSLAVLGLFASTLHLGRPMRAWRAFSQWRTSWLSREAVAAVATLVCGTLLAFTAFHDMAPLLLSLLALPTLVLALATVWCTGMIYESLPTIRAWSHWLTTEIYIVLALVSGLLVLTAILAIMGWLPPAASLLSAALLALAAVMKMVYWHGIDSAPRTHTAEAATGLGRFGKVRPLLEAHTRPNYVMREMGYVVARRHAMRLRSLTLLFAFALPIAFMLLIYALPVAAPVLAVLSVLSHAAGLLIERWLFFAEAQHVATLFYGADTA